MSAAKTIKQLRMGLYLEREEFAKLIGITKGAVFHYETGRRIPKLAIVKKMVDLAKQNGMDLSVNDFLD